MEVLSALKQGEENRSSPAGAACVGTKLLAFYSLGVNFSSSCDFCIGFLGRWEGGGGKGGLKSSCCAPIPDVCHGNILLMLIQRAAFAAVSAVVSQLGHKRSLQLVSQHEGPDPSRPRRIAAGDSGAPSDESLLKDQNMREERKHANVGFVCGALRLETEMPTACIVTFLRTKFKK